MTVKGDPPMPIPAPKPRPDFRGHRGCADDELLARKINKWGDETDTEHAHAECDKLLCAVLRALGYPKTVAAFEALDKWYA